MTGKSFKTISRRGFLAGATAATTLGMPNIVVAQTRELVVGGASSHKRWIDTIIGPHFEKKYNCKVVLEATRSLVNLEKMQKNKDKQYLSIVQMDDPVMILAVKEGLLEPLTTAKAPNVGKLKPGTIHMDGMWVNYLQPWVGIAYNTAQVKAPPTSWAELYDPKYKGRIILPSLQNTEGMANLFIASHFATGKPFAEAQIDAEAGFKKLVELKPNLLTVYSQDAQAYNLLEQGEAWMISSAISTLVLTRKASGAPVELIAPKEGVFPMPSGIALVKGGPLPELAVAYVEELLSPDIQSQIAAQTFSLPTNTAAKAAAGTENLVVHPIDWANVSANRAKWVGRWDREMSL